MRYLRLGLCAMLWALPASAQTITDTVDIGPAHADGTIPVRVLIQEGAGTAYPFDVHHRVPSATAIGDVAAWLNANVNANQRTAWAAKAAGSAAEVGTATPIRHKWIRASISEADLSPLERALFRFLFQEVNRARVADGLSPLTKAAVLNAIKDDLNTP